MSRVKEQARRQVSPVRVRAMRSMLVLAVMALTVPFGAAQATWQVESLIPEVISIRVPTTTIAFAPNQFDYPPAEFPAQYPATQPEGGVLPVQVFSNEEGLWSLILEVPDLLNEQGATVLSATQVLYRVNDGIWVRADGNPQIIYSQAGSTLGWLEIRIEFALELTGNELAGSYVVNAAISASRDPGF